MSIFFLFIFVFTYLDLLTYAKQTNHWEKKNEKKTENVINSDLTLGVKGGLGKQRHWQKESGWKQLQTMRNTKLVAFPHCIHMHNHTCIQSHTHSSQRQRQHSCVSLCLWDVEEENESWREQLLGGVDGAAPCRRITLERTHHLCSFVELSHFNLAPPVHSTLPLSPLPPLCCCSLVSGTHSKTHTFTKTTPTISLPHVCQEHQVEWRGWGLLLVCLYIFSAI